jgi:hypothetical protein
LERGLGVARRNYQLQTAAPRRDGGPNAGWATRRAPCRDGGPNAGTATHRAPSGSWNR